MDVTPEQRQEINRLVEYVCLINGEHLRPDGNHVMLSKVMIGLAFVLGVRFALKYPHQAGDFMHQWIVAHNVDGDLTGHGIHLEEALESGIRTIWEIKL